MRAAARALRQTSHRPWPLPAGRWIMYQSWRDLLFAHWPVSAAELRPLVPPELALEEHSGSAWVGVTPFRLTGLRPHGLPPVPLLSNFPEVNLRTYVRVRDTPGIHFFSLDAASRITVVGARLIYALPYHLARMSIGRDRDGWVHVRSRRRVGDAELTVRYRPVGAPFHPAAGTLEHFLTERYALLSVTANRAIVRGDIHHDRWSIQPSEAVISQNTLASAHGIELPGAPVLHFASRQDTVVWPPSRVTAS